MLDDLPTLAAEVTARILAEVPGLEAPEVAELVGTMSEANGAMVLNGLVRDLPVEEIVATADFVRGTQAVAHHRIPLASLLRAHRVGHAHWSNIWTEQVAASRCTGGRDCCRCRRVALHLRLGRRAVRPSDH